MPWLRTGMCNSAVGASMLLVQTEASARPVAGICACGLLLMLRARRGWLSMADPISMQDVPNKSWWCFPVEWCIFDLLVILFV